MTNRGRAPRLEEDPEFLSDYLKGSFIADVFDVMEEEDINKNELARRLGTSRQYITKVLGEEDPNNFTIDSIARVAAALKRDVSLRLKKYNEVVEIKEYGEWKYETQLRNSVFHSAYNQYFSILETFDTNIQLNQNIMSDKWYIIREVPSMHTSNSLADDTKPEGSISIPKTEREPA